ncbi:BamA/TamA family outer membrane protein [Mesoterricola silvestris]|uniref:Outer membrane protein assembly factor BamA n=1 Tax=Mesoterricola silvestris TaxID=2927979 RepID=A0AA48K943_9BACT|nr:BamA/TamA family outer membrane protein [Mesoterricola silvestris]BDU73624.1 outer membrane protein assembly factor BamA [Mesoterricola silvestris]
MKFFGAPLVLLAVPALGLGQAPVDRLEFQGGSLDDQVFARSAAGLKPGHALTGPEFQAALEAIRATDRFRTVEGGAGVVRLDPWPRTTGILVRGDAPSSLRRGLFPGLRRGDRVGALRLEAQRAQAQERLVAAGFPAAKVAASRAEGDARLVLDIAAGTPNLIRGVEVVGKVGPFTPQSLIRETQVVPGKTLWNRDLEIECLRRLRKKLVGAKRFEGRVDLDWDTGGVLRITVDVGPKVLLKSDGAGLGWTTSLKDLVPLTRADRYTPDLLDEGERRLVRLFRSRGHLDPQVTYTRQITRTGPEGPEEVVVTYHLAPGPVSRLGAYTFEGNQAVGEKELRKAADVGGFLGAKARPELMDAAENHIQALYESRGFTEAKVRRSVVLRDGKADLVFRIREGRQRLVAWARLDLPAGGFGDPWGLGSGLALLFADKPVFTSAADGTRVYRSDRPGMEGCLATLAQTEVEGRLRVTLTFSRPIPLLKADFFRAYTDVRQQHLVALGVLRPTVRSEVVEEGANCGILFEVPDQPMEKVDRVVVRGAGRTRAKAILREINLKPGDPLDQDKLGRAQGRLGGLGAFQRVEVSTLAEGQEAGPPSPWKAGDLLFRTEERSPWVVTNSLGYDRTQGYYLGMGVQRLNVGGMGRTLDFNARAGDGFLHNPTLRDLFPTGRYTRSLDSISLGYTDPWFEAGALGQALPDRTSFRTEGAYIQEQRYIYQVRRRRVLSSLRWALPSRVAVEAGYRFERVEVAASIDNISSADLAKIAKYPDRAIISSPYLQLVRDTRDNPFDPTSGVYSLARFEAASQFFLTSKNSSFIKLDLRNQWTWPVGYKAQAGVVAFGVRVGLAVPTAKTAEDLPLSERFFAGGSGTMRGVEPDFLGPLDRIPLFSADGSAQMTPGPGGIPIRATEQIPLGGQALFIANLEYRFPMLGQTLWGEVFVDTGQVYQKPGRTYSVDSDGNRTRLPLRTALGLGIIVKLGIPLKLEYAADVDRILGRPRSEGDRSTQLRNVTISAGFQF